MVLSELLNDRKVILASSSPRRQELLKGMGISFTIIHPDVEESYPIDLQREEIPVFLAEKKAALYDMAQFDEKSILITADTIVWVNGHVMNKPADREDAINMLKTISGNMHEVYTAVCLKKKSGKKSFFSHSRVYFRALTDEEIYWYIDNFKPYDKAGAYGIQEWIGYIGIEHVEGSFFNVMGLPTQRLYRELMEFSK